MFGPCLHPGKGETTTGNARVSVSIAAKVERRGGGGNHFRRHTPSSRFFMQTPTMGASEPILNVPRVVVLVAAAMIGIQIVRSLLPDEESVQVLLALAFIPARYSGAAAELPGGYLTTV